MKKKKIVTAILACAISASCVATLAACGPGEHTPGTIEINKTTAVVRGYEWGPAISKIIIEFKGNVSGVTKDTFEVKMKTGFSAAKRTVTDAYVCDKDGAKTTAQSKFVAVEMSSKYGEGSPFTYDQQAQVNKWNDSIPVTVTVLKGKSITVGETKYLDGDKFEYTVKPADRVVPQTASWAKDTYNYTGGGKNITLSRANWKPAGADDDGMKNPLVIWLHGGGEGGTDIDIDLLGNEVTALTSENETNVQHYFATGNSAGAYVLAVQTPTMWMDVDGTGNYGDSDASATPSGRPQTSYYTEALWGAITDYVTKTPDIDTDRIYIGGCSNGGYMTVNLALEHGDYFAAYYPICQGYMSGNIDDTMLAKLKDLNMWFLLSEDDGTLDPDKYTIPLYYRLIRAGAQNVHLTLTDHVRGKDDPNPSGGYGAPQGCYMGHWSWIYAFNDEVKKEFDNTLVTSQDYLTSANCTKDGNMWQWLAAQAKEVAPVETYTFEAENAKITDGTATVITGWGQNGPEYGDGPAHVTVESGNTYAETGTGAAVTNLGSFVDEGTKAVWEITAEEECDVTITLHAASALVDQSKVTYDPPTYQPSGLLSLTSVDLSQNEYVKLSVNGTPAALSGTLPGLTDVPYSTIATIYRYFGTGTTTQTVHLNKGKNTIMLEAVKKDGGLNIDKIVISGTTVKLSYIPAVNADRLPQQQPQG